MFCCDEDKFDFNQGMDMLWLFEC